MKISTYIKKYAGKDMFELHIPNFVGNKYHRSLAIQCYEDNLNYKKVVIEFAKSDLFICNDLWEAMKNLIDSQYVAIDDEDTDKENLHI